MPDPSNYAAVDDTFRVSAKRFARSPWLSSYITPETVLGVYSGRFFPLTLGEDPVDAYWNLRRGVTLFDVPEHPVEISGPGALFPARVVSLPFYDAEKRIPRGLAGASP